MRAEKKAIKLAIQYLLVPSVILWLSLTQLSAVEFPQGGVKDAVTAKITDNIAFTLTNSLKSNAIFAFNMLIGLALFLRFYDPKKEGLASTITGAFILASVTDYALLLALGGLGIYTPVPLALTSIIMLAYLIPKGRIISLRNLLKKTEINYEHATMILLVLILGLTPFKLLVYAYPVTLWKDITPNHIAPAQMVVNYGKYLPLKDYPSSTYTRAKNLPGITAIYAFTCVLSGERVYKAITPLVMLLFPILLASAYLLARRLLGEEAAPWACLFLLFSGAYLRLGDIRGTSLSFIYAAAALSYLADYLRGQKNKIYLSALSTGFCFMINPLIAPILAAVQALAITALAASKRQATLLTAGVKLFSIAFITGSLYFYQIAVETGFITVFMILMPAAVIGAITTLGADKTPKTKKAGLPVLASAFVACALYFYPTEFAGQMYSRLSNNFPLIACLGALGFLALFFRSREYDAVSLSIVYGIVLVAGIIYFFLGNYYSSIEFSPHIALFFVEMDHKIDYWATYFLGFLSAGFIGYVYERIKKSGTSYIGRLAATTLVLFLVISPYSIRGGDIGLGRKLSGQGENKVSDFWMVAASWIVDENRYWHPRALSPLQEEVAGQVDSLIASRQIGYYDVLLNVNPPFGYLEELPSFTGVRELRVVSEHVPNRWGTGEGIRTLAELDSILSEGAPGFLLVSVDSVDEESMAKLMAVYQVFWTSSDGMVKLAYRK
ncbi:MAG: hypothetical protein ABH834_04100 [Candidatus Altiarchaeota archaeon]